MSGASHLVEDVAQIVERIHWSELPGSTRAAAERCTLHVLATTYLGARRTIARQTVDYATRYAPGDSLIIGRGYLSIGTEAALANATMCHADFRDDAHAPSQSHPGVTVIPAALAAAQIIGVDVAADRLGTAVVAGYQVIGRLGRLGAITSTERGFRASAIYSIFGGAVAAAIVLGLTGDRLRAAIALAAQSAAGLNQPYLDGTDDWILLPGQAARNGLQAALLAREGVDGAPGNLDGALGFFRAYADVTEPAPIDDPSFPDWEIEATRLKTVLTCGWNQSPINTLLRSGVPLEEVGTLEVRLSQEAYEFAGVVNYGPFTSYTAAALSLPFAVGSLLSTGLLDSSSYDDVAVPVIAENAKRVTVTPSRDNHGYDLDLTIRHRDGEVTTIRTPGGEPQWLLTWPEVVESLEEKYRRSGLDQERLRELVGAVPGALAGGGLDALFSALEGPGTSGAAGA